MKGSAWNQGESVHGEHIIFNGFEFAIFYFEALCHHLIKYKDGLHTYICICEVCCVMLDYMHSSFIFGIM